MVKKNTRPNIPEPVRIQIWTEAAGRCQFRNCNKPLWYSELTLNKTNFGEMAHIIGASKDGPRGNEQSQQLAKDPENILLLCRDHHVEIDRFPEQFPVEMLKEMKKEHTDRVRMLLDQPSKRTRPFIFTTQIGGQDSMFSERSILKAILPDHPESVSSDWFRVETGFFDRNHYASWEVAKHKLESEIDSVRRSIKSGKVSHLSVFALAPQPLLMWLGRQLGDKVSAQIFEPRRTDDQDKKWTWDEDDGMAFRFQTSIKKVGKSKNVILLFSLSDYLEGDKYEGLLADDKASEYVLTIDEPVQGFLTMKSQKAAFIQACRSLLNQIQKDVGKDCIIHVLPAMPASLAVEFGRLLQPTKDPKVWVYENTQENDKPRKIFELL